MSNPQIVRAIKLCAIFCFIGWAVFYSLFIPIFTPTFHLDGAFQTASGLYRLDAGQMPGRDFFPYLGIGPLFILFPLFKLLGSNLAASGFSAQFIVLIFGAAAVSIIWHLIFKPEKKIDSILAGSVLFIGSLATLTATGHMVPNWLQFGLTPGNSLKPVRAFLPYMAIAFLAIPLGRIGAIRFLYRGAFCGAILLWSNDFALSTAALFSLLMIPLAGREKCINARCIASYTAALTVSAVTLYCITTAGHPLDFLKYNFIDVAKDQWWYFGAYGETARIYNLGQLTRLFAEDNYLPTAVLLATSAYAAVSKRSDVGLVSWIGLALFAGGAVASVGGHLGDYMGPFYFWGAWVVIVSALTIVEKTFNAWDGRRMVVSIGSLALSIAALTLSITAFESSSSSAKHNPDLFYSPELGGYLNNEWKDYIEMAKDSKNSIVIEEYWGLWSATRKSFSGWPVDSVIHALGGVRVIASERLKNANIVISTRNSLSNVWQPWSLSQNYWFYKELIENFTPYATSPNTLVWKRKATTARSADTACIYTNAEPAMITISNDKKGFYEVTMEYEFSSNGRFLTMIKNNISFAANAQGYVSFDPAGSIVTFPAYLKNGSTPLDVTLIGAAPRTFSIKSCRAKFITDNDDEVTKRPD
ncbi:hypothetical protein [Pseudomonas sp. LB3P58]